MLKRLNLPTFLLALSFIAMPMTEGAHAASHHRHGDHVALKAPLVHVDGVVERVFVDHRHHHGADHQHFIVRVTDVIAARGMAPLAMAPLVFVALRFGDRDGLDHPIRDLAPGQPIELQGEYVDPAHAYPTQDNEGHPPLPVLHFTHHPVGYVIYEGHRYD